MHKITKALLFLGLAICLLQVWWPAYYLTGDGPCHLYNAQILHDLWSNKNVDFYSRFFELNCQPNPNWLTTLVLALLLFIAKGVIAEKIFLSLYIILFLSGFLLLLRKINNNNQYWVLAIFIFIFTNALAKGFYNFSFGIAFFFWMVWSWLRLLEKINAGNAILFLFFTLLSFFTHLLPFVFAFFTCAALVGSFAISQPPGNKNRLYFFLKYAILLAFLLSPSLLLTGWFIRHGGGVQLHLRHHFYRLIELISFKYAVNEAHTEDVFAAVGAAVLLFLFSASLIFFVKGKFKGNKYDGLFISLLFILFIYFFFPDDLPGFLDITLRVQLFVFLLIACFIAYSMKSAKIKNLGGLILFLCFAGLSIARISNLLTASDGVEDCVSAGKYIKPLSVILPLDFSRSGMDEKWRPVSDRNWLFCHQADYLAIEKPLIILDNYEANQGYFAFGWREKVNPFLHLSKEQGIEGMPPYVSIAGYKQTSGVSVDYILMWCYDSSYLRNQYFSKLYHEINEGYHIVYTSPTARTILYEKNYTPQGNAISLKK